MHWGYEEDLTPQRAWGEVHEAYGATHYMFPACWDTLINIKHIDEGINRMKQSMLSP